MMTVQGSSLKRSLVASVLFHAGMVVGAYVTLPNLKSDLAPDERVIVVEMVDMAEITNAPQLAPELEPKPEAKAEPEPPPPAPEPIPVPEPEVAAQEPVPVPDPVPDPAPPAPEPEVAALPPRPEPEPEMVKPEPKPDPEPSPTPEVKPEIKPAPEMKVAKVLNEMKPVDKPKPPPPPDPLASVLKTLEELKAQPPAPESEEKKDEKKTAETKSFEDQIADALKVTSTKPPDTSKPISISTIEAVRERIRPCWNLQAGSKNAGELIVAIRVHMNPDATVSNAEVVNAERMLTDNVFRIAAETALRAVRNPKCQPFPLPNDQYQQWRSMTLNFDPSQML